MKIKDKKLYILKSLINSYEAYKGKYKSNVNAIELENYTNYILNILANSKRVRVMFDDIDITNIDDTLFDDID